jgi:KamA family protein
MEEKMKVYTGMNGFEEFCDFIALDDGEREARRKCLLESNMPFQVNEYYAEVIKEAEGTDRQQLLNIILPPVAEKKFTGRFDPYGNKKYRKDDKIYLQHKYKQTLLVHINNACFSRCQFCYKVNEVNNDESFFYRTIADDAVVYLRQHPEVNNILLTGGDPMMLSNEALSYILGKFSDLPQIRGIRIATKTLSFYPIRFLDEELLSILSDCNKKKKHISVIAQISHPAEFSAKMIEAVEKIQKTGASIRSQPVLTHGINDDVKVLTALFQKAYDCKIVPYYLVHFMPVRGVEQYALPIDEAYKIVAQLSAELSGLEKKSIFITAHDYGKFEICGFCPSVDQPEEIILKWHQIVNEMYLPKAFVEKVSIEPGSLLKLKYKKGSLYNLDDLFAYNNIP